MSSTWQIKVNGGLMELSTPSSLEELLIQLGVSPLATVVELNGEVILRESFAATELRSGDTIEIVRIVGGG